jgi:hypothetical protein
MVPIYRSDGEWVAVYEKGNLFNVDGEWLGFAAGRDVYDLSGMYLGFLSDDQRLLRTRTRPQTRPRLVPPPKPDKPSIPANMPLAPLLSSLPYSVIDLFEMYPEKLSHISETRPDMD